MNERAQKKPLNMDGSFTDPRSREWDFLKHKTNKSKHKTISEFTVNLNLSFSQITKNHGLVSRKSNEDKN
jgi:hypothetical protein